MESDRPLESSKASCVIYFHEGFSPYLPFALSQAARSNPGARIILLGNQQNKIKGISYEHHMLSDYSKRQQEFVESYQHFHPGCLEDERRCIERWIVLAEFVQRHRIEEFLFLDSDTLLFEDVRKLFERCRGYDAGGTPIFTGLCAFLKKNLVPDFADWILEQYRNPAVVQAWERRFQRHMGGERDEGAVIQDMALAMMFIQEKGIRVLDLTQPKQGKMVDSGQFGRAFQHGTKEIDILIQAHPGSVVSTIQGGKRIDLTAVHVNGYYKNHMPGLTGWSRAVFRSFFRPNYRRNLQQLCIYLWNGFRFRHYLRKNYEIHLGLRKR
jgi:hypothetical protein